MTDDYLQLWPPIAPEWVVALTPELVVIDKPPGIAAPDLADPQRSSRTNTLEARARLHLRGLGLLDADAWLVPVLAPLRGPPKSVEWSTFASGLCVLARRQDVVDLARDQGVSPDQHPGRGDQASKSGWTAHAVGIAQPWCRAATPPVKLVQPTRPKPASFII